MKRFLRLVKSTGIWAPGAVLLFHQFASIKVWRSQIDWINHYSGGLSFTYFAWKSLPLLARWTGRLTAIGRLAVAFLSGCTAALLWEIGEFGSDLVLGTMIQKSVQETMMDIVNGFLGTLTAILIIGFATYRSQRDVAPRPR